MIFTVESENIIYDLNLNRISTTEAVALIYPLNVDIINIIMAHIFVKSYLTEYPCISQNLTECPCEEKKFGGMPL